MTYKTSEPCPECGQPIVTIGYDDVQPHQCSAQPTEGDSTMNSTDLDLDSIDSVRAELIATVNATDYGLTAEGRGDRIRAAARVSFLASRLNWLESSEISHSERVAKYAAA